MKEKLDLDKYLQETVVRRYIVTGFLHNIHGEHNERTLGKTS